MAPREQAEALMLQGVMTGCSVKFELVCRHSRSGRG